jgi:hypothetical protein
MRRTISLTMKQGKGRSRSTTTEKGVGKVANENLLQNRLPKPAKEDVSVGFPLHYRRSDSKCESRRRWKSLEPYVTMMKMLLKTTMGDGWQIMADVLAKVSPAEEQKDIRVRARPFDFSSG